MSGPVIGIAGSRYVVPRFWGELPVVGAPTSYANAVLAAGGLPILLVDRCATASLDLVDALILTGGGDVDPTWYGGDPATARDVDRGRDEAEFALVRAAAEAAIPLLGVCRGMQVLSIAFGGTLTPDLGMTHVRLTTGHPVQTQPGSLLNHLLGPTAHVTSLHHQSIADPGSPWTITATANDGTPEAIEWRGPTRWQALGVQWHPELTDPTGPALFGWLTQTCQLPSTTS
ncbi:gamma-glutamyl-gamma-aminobutyrate hydrolase family protein [Kribbella sp. NPDC002412]